MTALEEAAQLLSPARTFDPTDLVANLAGILCFTWLASRLQSACNRRTALVERK